MIEDLIDFILDDLSDLIVELFGKTDKFIKNKKEIKRMKKGLLGGISLGVIIVIVLIVVSSLTERVPNGYVGVQYSINGGVKDDVLNQGWHIITPGTKVTDYTIGIEQGYLTAGEDGDSQGNDSFEVPTKDGKGLTVDMAYTFRFDESRIVEIFKKFKGRSGDEVKSSFIKPNIMSWSKEVTAMYPVTEILGDKRADINVELTKYLREKFDEYGIIIENATFTNIDPDSTTRDAIQKKVNAQQEKELAEIEAKTAKINAEKEKEVAKINAEKDKEVAEINAEKTKIKAQGEADALRVKAEAEAKANKMISDSLSDKLIESQKIEKWNGDVPKIQGSTTPIISMNE